jgi:hypothetical protein
MTLRALTTNERSIISAIAQELDAPDRIQLLADLENATARTVATDGSLIEFEIAGYARPAFRGENPFDVEGRVLDNDGAELLVLVHADHNGRLLELELVRFERGEVIGPDWSTLQLYRSDSRESSSE